MAGAFQSSAFQDNAFQTSVRVDGGRVVMRNRIQNARRLRAERDEKDIDRILKFLMVDVISGDD